MKQNWNICNDLQVILWINVVLNVSFRIRVNKHSETVALAAITDTQP